MKNIRYIKTMLGKKIIIDAAYPNETRVALCQDGIVKDFRYQSSIKNFTKGNIYLARIEKIELSLQAIFVEYGGDKQGFLPFSEIHPKYYINSSSRYYRQFKRNIDGDFTIEEENFTTFKKLHKKLTNSYYNGNYSNIHNVISKNQTILVQVEKDNRGNKGASLTTFLSLPGRYCVLLPNSNRTNLISRLIEDEDERNRLMIIADELSEFETYSAIIIKSGAAYKTKAEIVKDFSYLLRLWKQIKKCIRSDKVPLFIHKEGDIIKQSLRDLCDSEINEIVISGKKDYNNIVEFVKEFLPKHKRKIALYDKVLPIFIEYGIQKQIISLYNNIVSLPSGGYLVINQTEALTSIDINSGRAKDISNSDEMFYAINLEAAKEVVRQIILRNISGLIVIDFISMISKKADEELEKIIADGLNNNVARTNILPINEFGLLTMTRQRLDNTLYESSFQRCDACFGRGIVRASALTAAALFKALHEEVALLEDNAAVCVIEVITSTEVIIDIMNNSKVELAKLESQYHIRIRFHVDNSNVDTFCIKRGNTQNEDDSEALSTMDFSDDDEDDKIENVFSKDIVYAFERQNSDSSHMKISDLTSITSSCYKQRKNITKPRKHYSNLKNQNPITGQKANTKKSFLKRVLGGFLEKKKDIK